MAAAKKEVAKKVVAKKRHGVRNGAFKAGGTKKAIEDTYDEFKEFEGQYYTGMQVGRTHKWYYDQGEWKERKMTPDEWTFEFATKKRRAGKAPKGSGVPVGTEYHWYILAHQNVSKFNANIYTTALSGIKYKLAHKRAAKGKWSVSEKGQQKKLIRFLQTLIKRLEKEIED
jgi:hypothetical protein